MAWLRGRRGVGAAAGRLRQSRRARALLQSRSEAAVGGPVALPSLSKEERQALGDYAQAYGIMSDYQAELRKAAQPLREVLATETLRSVGDIVARRDALTLARKTLQANVAAVRERARGRTRPVPRWNCRPIWRPPMTACTTNPDRPANELLAAADTLDAVARDALAIADFVAANAAGIELAGRQARVATPSLQQALNLRLQGLNAQSDDLERAREQIRRAVGPSLTDPAATPSAGAASTPATGVVSAPAAGSVAAPAAVRR